mmetsp:Transcript_7826/g.13483  ORF Transcript_7826/g.13483 Transcript_7826/m.13483 type:complete len:340 (+) Transcript_7826:366-1385(+)
MPSTSFPPASAILAASRSKFITSLRSLGMKAPLNTASATWRSLASSLVSSGRVSANRSSSSSRASTPSSVVSGSVTKSNSSFTFKTACTRDWKKSVTCVQSSRRKMRARGWSRSTLWLTSMITSCPAWYRMLYSDRSACTSRHFWNITLMASSSSRYASLHRLGGSTASFSRGDAHPSTPMNSISSTCERSMVGLGTFMPQECMRSRLRNSFSAHVFTILRGLFLPYPWRNRKSPETYLSRSRKTRMEVLKTLMARESPSGVEAWYTLASLPVDTHPFTSVITLEEIILNSTMRVRGSNACSTVARSALSCTRIFPRAVLRSFSFTTFATLPCKPKSAV